LGALIRKKATEPKLKKKKKKSSNYDDDKVE